MTRPGSSGTADEIPYDIAIIGAGYAGTWALMSASDLARQTGAPIRMVMIAPEPVLTARPRLYESRLEEGQARLPLDPLLRDAGADFLAGTVEAIDDGVLRVRSNGTSCDLAARTIVVASGSASRVPDNLAAYTVDDFATAGQFWLAVRQAVRSARVRKPVLLVIGAGVTGIEAAIEAAERYRRLLDVQLIDPAPTLQGWSAPAARYLDNCLRRAGVSVRWNARAVEQDSHHLHLSDGTVANADLVLWAGGMRPQSLTSFAIDKAKDGRAIVSPDLRRAGRPNVFWAGDVAAAPAPDIGRTVMSCQYAIQLGEVAGRNAVRHVLGLEPECFAPRPYVTCIGLGPEDGLLTSGPMRSVLQTGMDAARTKRFIVEDAIVPTALRARVPGLTIGP